VPHTAIYTVVVTFVTEAKSGYLILRWNVTVVICHIIRKTVRQSSNCSRDFSDSK